MHMGTMQLQLSILGKHPLVSSKPVARHHIQVSKCTPIWHFNNPSLLWKCICYEKIGCPWLWGPSPGEYINIFDLDEYWLLEQCAIPVFEGLLPSVHDKRLQRLLFELAVFHGLAKLQLHTATTLQDLENLTVRLGNYLWYFEEHICPTYDTKDLPSEVVARGRRRTAKAAKLPSGSKATTGSSTTASGAKSRKYNLFTYKNHSLGDIAEAIQKHGTTDSYSSQLVQYLSIFLICIQLTLETLERTWTSTHKEFLFSCEEGEAYSQHCKRGHPWTHDI